MSKPVKISGNEYSYKGFVIARVYCASSPKSEKWCIEKNGVEVAYDLRRLWVAVDQIDQGRFD